jgi:hypothetical protein
MVSIVTVVIKMCLLLGTSFKSCKTQSSVPLLKWILIDSSQKIKCVTVVPVVESKILADIVLVGASDFKSSHTFQLPYIIAKYSDFYVAVLVRYPVEVTDFL